MTEIHLSGRLVCQSLDESALVARLLPTHVALTRAEPGCLAFDVTPTEDPLVWRVAERFADEVAFTAHQARVAASEWGRRTSGIVRDYTVTGLA